MRDPPAAHIPVNTNGNMHTNSLIRLIHQIILYKEREWREARILLFEDLSTRKETIKGGERRTPSPNTD